MLSVRVNPQFNRIQRLAGYERLAKGGGLPNFVERLNIFLQHVGRWIAIVGFLAVGLTLLLVRSFESLGVFRLWMVNESSVSGSEFGAAAYEGWWASADNFAGWMVYLTIAALGVLVILLQNIVGLVAVYLIAGLPAFCDFETDWYDRDGNFGWRPLGTAFRTVRWSLIIHGIALTVLFAMVGAGVAAYTLPLLGLWLFVIPLYLVLPSYVFRNVGATVKSKALERAAEQSHDTMVGACLVVPFIQQASVKPLRISRFGVYAFAGSVLLPVGLTVAQIAAE